MKKGFTLIEILTVILLIGIVSAIVTVNYNRYLDASSLSAYKDSMLSLIEQLENYTLSNPLEDHSTEQDINMRKLQLENKNTITSGKYKVVDNFIELVKVTDGNYCATGNKNNLTIVEGDCN